MNPYWHTLSNQSSWTTPPDRTIVTNGGRSLVNTGSSGTVTVTWYPTGGDTDFGTAGVPAIPPTPQPHLDGGIALELPRR